ncbi:AcrR family transcriptional regulator [Spinactinospora alkalitolerans]|uniref:AcrR family transcriptional regulator n=1 Tax=Spinactinospora alkalitolerans TaxID=687207 RepID=A0A852TYN6_9ACTN|nr:TetR/AcrR family transcriptional regulator [Spinactinospora alkalitolerans]NYE48112.1 AcrR family transcriptional regulator [Spinactinospora alkalitolerans]
MATGERAQRAPKRQARGERRIGQILGAATEVFAEAGYEAATTNAIAARAGISPGSLYQFFGNKDDIVRALAERYAGELAGAHAAAFEGDDLAALPTESLVRRVLGPLIRFNREHRGFKVLFARTDLPPALTEATAPLHEAMLQRVTALFAVRAPERAPEDLRHAAVVAIQLVKALMPLIVGGGPAEGARFERELHTLLVDYLTRVLGASPAD